MKKKIIALAAALFLAAPCITAHAEKNEAVYILSAPAPESASEYAAEDFGKIDAEWLKGKGFTEKEAKTAYLSPEGFCYRTIDGGYFKGMYYYFIIADGKVKRDLGVQHILDASLRKHIGKYSFGWGTEDAPKALKKLGTSIDDPAELYWGEYVWYAVNSKGAVIVRWDHDLDESGAEAEMEIIKKLYAEHRKKAIPVICFGDFETGLVTAGGKIFYVEESGRCAAGWKTVDGKQYYFRQNGEAVTKDTTIDNVRYSFSADGVCGGRYTGLTKAGGERFYYIDGVKKYGWQKLPDGWHYFDKTSGAMISWLEKLNSAR